jgi:hypothetical protein
MNEFKFFKKSTEEKSDFSLDNIEVEEIAFIKEMFLATCVHMYDEDYSNRKTIRTDYGLVRIINEITPEEEWNEHPTHSTLYCKTYIILCTKRKLDRQYRGSNNIWITVVEHNYDGKCRIHDRKVINGKGVSLKDVTYNLVFNNLEYSI